LRPYTHWEELIPEVTRLWTVYTSIAEIARITRIATRYINVIQFPGPSVNMDEYLTAPPAVPKGLPQELGSFLQRVVLRFKEEGVQAIVTQSPAPSGSGKDETARILLDIDAFIEREVVEADVWTCFETLRSIKNRVFISYLTEKALELFR